MRHNVYGAHLSRTSEQRSLLFRSLIENLLLHKSIQTTESKAKAVKGLVDRVITQAREKNHRAVIATFVKNEKALEQLSKEVLPNLGARRSGYTNMVRIGQRKGDGTMMVRMSLLLEQKTDKKEKSDIERKARTRPIRSTARSKVAVRKDKSK